jgi:hypothetical protein
LLQLETHRVKCQWLTPVILATQGAELRGIVVQSQPPPQKRAGRVAQGVGPEFKLQYCKKKKKRRKKKNTWTQACKRLAS